MVRETRGHRQRHPRAQAENPLVPHSSKGTASYHGILVKYLSKLTEVTSVVIALELARRYLKPHNVVSTIDVDGFAGDARAGIGRKKYAGAADFADLHVTPQWSALGVRMQHVTEAGNAA